MVVELLTACDGRVAVLAKGARRPRSVYRGLLQPFHRLNIRYGIRGDLKSLISAEWDGSGNSMIVGKRLLSGFYINELLMKLLQKNEACPKLFIEYEKTLIALSNVVIPLDVILRRFEIYMLMHMGVLPDFKSASKLMDNNKIYYITFKDGIKILDKEHNYITVKDKLINLHKYDEAALSEQFVSLSTVRAIASYDSSINDFVSFLSVPKIAQETKKLLRLLISYQLGDFNLRSRKLIMDLTKFSKSRQKRDTND